MKCRYDIKKCMNNTNAVDTLSYLSDRNAKIRELQQYYRSQLEVNDQTLEITCPSIAYFFIFTCRKNCFH